MRKFQPAFHARGEFRTRFTLGIMAAMNVSDLAAVIKTPIGKVKPFDRGRFADVGVMEGHEDEKKLVRRFRENSRMVQSEAAMTAAEVTDPRTVRIPSSERMVNLADASVPGGGRG